MDTLSLIAYIIKVNLTFFFFSVLWEHLRLHIWITFVAFIIFLLGSAVLDPISSPHLFGNVD